jgi:fatty acid desaturase
MLDDRWLPYDRDVTQQNMERNLRTLRVGFLAMAATMVGMAVYGVVIRSWTAPVIGCLGLVALGLVYLGAVRHLREIEELGR